MSALLAAGAACARPGCGHAEDLHDGICFGATCECVRFVEPTGALPMPAGPAPLTLTEQQIEALVAAGDRVVNDEMHQRLCMCDAWPTACVSSGNYFMGSWDVDGLEAALPAVLGLWERMRGGELLALRARVAELETAPLAWAERLDLKSLDNLLISLGQASEHEPMDEAIGQIHLILAGFREAVASSAESECACPPTDRPHQVGCPQAEVPAPLFPTVASLREPEGEFTAFLRHPYRTGHDLPETGGGCRG